MNRGGGAATISAYIDDSVDAFTAVRNGNIVDISDEVVMGTHLLAIVGGEEAQCGNGDHRLSRGVRRWQHGAG